MQKSQKEAVLIMTEPVYAKILKYALYAAFVVGIIFVISLPFMLESYIYLIHGTSNINPQYRAFIIPFLLGVGVLSLWAILEMVMMLRSIAENPFVLRNVKALYRIGVLALVLSVAFTVKCFLFFTILTMFCAFLFTGAGLFAFTLAALIRQSIVFREENELTI